METVQQPYPAFLVSHNPVRDCGPGHRPSDYAGQFPSDSVGQHSTTLQRVISYVVTEAEANAGFHCDVYISLGMMAKTENSKSYKMAKNKHIRVEMKRFLPRPRRSPCWTGQVIPLLE
jgi:hypothetical protein